MAEQKPKKRWLGRLRKERTSGAEITERNRENAARIAAVLRTIDFTNLNACDGIGEEARKTLIGGVELSVERLERACAAADDLSRLDKLLLEAALTLKTAVEHEDPVPYLSQALWCANTLAAGDCICA